MPSRCGSIGGPTTDMTGEVSWKSRESGERPGTALDVAFVCVCEDATEAG